MSDTFSTSPVNPPVPVETPPVTSPAHVGLYQSFLNWSHGEKFKFFFHAIVMIFEKLGLEILHVAAPVVVTATDAFIAAKAPGLSPILEPIADTAINETLSSADNALLADLAKNGEASPHQ